MRNARRTNPVPFVAILAALQLVSPCAGALELETILDRAMVTPPARVRFREERQNALLREPLVLEGYLEYLGPGVLGKVVESPFHESFLIDDGQITIERNGETRSLPMNRTNELETILGAIEAILAGEPRALESVFSVEVSGNLNGWSVLLKPRSPRIAAHLSSLIISGDDKAVARMLVLLKGGEQHAMYLLHDPPQS